MVAPEILLKSITSNRHHQRCSVVNLKKELFILNDKANNRFFYYYWLHMFIALSLHDQYTIKIFVQLSLKRALILFQRGERGIGNSRPRVLFEYFEK